MIVDDEEVVRRVLVATAARFCTAEAVATAAEAISRLQSDPFDAVLSDTELGVGPSGLWLLREIATRWPRVRRYLMSARPQKTTEAFLMKPIDAPMLWRIVRGPDDPAET